MLRVLIAIEANPHREPLNDLDKVAAGIFRWQKAEQRSSSTGKILDRPSVVATERINMNVHRLTRAHVFELSFLEVRRHPDIVKGNDGKQTLSWLNSLAKFDGFAANDSAHRSIDSRIAEIELGRANVRLGLAHLASARLRFCLGIAYLLWGSAGSLDLGLSLSDQAAQLPDLVLLGSNHGAIGFERLRICECLCFVGIVLQLGDYSALNQPFVPDVVPFGASRNGLILFHSVLCGG